MNVSQSSKKDYSRITIGYMTVLSGTVGFRGAGSYKKCKLASDYKANGKFNYCQYNLSP